MPTDLILVTMWLFGMVTGLLLSMSWQRTRDWRKLRQQNEELIRKIDAERVIQRQLGYQPTPAFKPVQTPHIASPSEAVWPAPNPPRRRYIPQSTDASIELRRLETSWTSGRYIPPGATVVYVKDGD